MILFTTQPLIVDKNLAKAIGLNEAIILQQVHYWIEKNKDDNRNFHNNRYWTYNTIEEWQEEFPFWSKDTVRRTFKKLRELGFIIVDKFNTYKMDKTLWYTIDYDKLNDPVIQSEAKDLDVQEHSSKSSTPKQEVCPHSLSVIQSEAKDLIPLATCQSPSMQNAKMETSNLPQAIPEITTENPTEIYNPSVSQANSQHIVKNAELKKTTYLQTEYENIIHECELDSIDSKYNNAVAFAIKLLLLDIQKCNTVKIGQHNYPSKTIKQDLKKLNFFVIEHAVNKFKQASEIYEIKNVIGYLKSCIYNAIHEIDIDLDANLRNAGYY